MSFIRSGSIAARKYRLNVVVDFIDFCVMTWSLGSVFARLLGFALISGAREGVLVSLLFHALRPEA